MKYEYYVEPEADIQNLQVKVDGAELINHGTSLQIATVLGNIQDANLKVFDQWTGKSILSNFLVQNNTFSFQNIPKKRKNIIVIDPLVYSTYLGGSKFELDPKISLDESGNVFITGGTYSTDFPTTPGAFQTINKGKGDSFVAKLNPTGTALVYSTFLGGSGQENTFSGRLDIDEIGNAFICGDTQSADFPTTTGAFQTLCPYLGNTGYVTKLNPTGTVLEYSTYLGGSDNAAGGYGITLDKLGNAYIFGDTWSTDYPTTPGAYQTTHKGNRDVFVTKINPTGTALIYSTFLGGSVDDSPFGSYLDVEGNLIIAGYTSSEDFPTTLGTYQNNLKRSNNIFMSKNVIVSKVNTIGSDILYSTYFGENLLWRERSGGIVIDNSGKAYICGQTYSSRFFTTPGAFQTKCNGYVNAFISKLDLFLFDISLTGSLHFNQVNLSWNNINPDNNVINGYQIYRANVADGFFSPLAYVDGTNN
jgi:hypothetical protein